MFLPTNDKQFEFWKMRRSGMPNITIANLRGISRQAVSRALLLMDERIESTLQEMAQANQIAVAEDQCRAGYSDRKIHTFPGCSNCLCFRKTRCAGMV